MVFSVDIFVVKELVFVDKWGDEVWTGGSILHPVFTSEHFISPLPYSRPSTVGSVWAKLLLLSY